MEAHINQSKSLTVKNQPLTSRLQEQQHNDALHHVYQNLLLTFERPSVATSLSSSLLSRLPGGKAPAAGSSTGAEASVSRCSAAGRLWLLLLLLLLALMLPLVEATEGPAGLGLVATAVAEALVLLLLLGVELTAGAWDAAVLLVGAAAPCALRAFVMTRGRWATPLAPLLLVLPVLLAWLLLALLWWKLLWPRVLKMVDAGPRGPSSSCCVCCGWARMLPWPVTTRWGGRKACECSASAAACMIRRAVGCQQWHGWSTGIGGRPPVLHEGQPASACSIIPTALASSVADNRLVDAGKGGALRCMERQACSPGHQSHRRSRTAEVKCVAPHQRQLRWPA